MKMEIPLMAPEDGVVKKILVEEGSQIAEGEVLFLMDV
jgi:acetyl-CoA carboxylase biotin carboxyl carrier protein